MSREPAKGKKFQPHSPMTNTTLYPIIRYSSNADFKKVVTQLNDWVRYYQVNLIGLFMYDSDLDFFVAQYRKTQCKGLPYLYFAINHFYNTFYRVNRTQTDSPQQDEDGEWVDVDDDCDDEIHFKVNDKAEDSMLNDQLDDTNLISY